MNINNDFNCLSITHEQLPAYFQSTLRTTNNESLTASSSTSSEVTYNLNALPTNFAQKKQYALKKLEQIYNPENTQYTLTPQEYTNIRNYFNQSNLPVDLQNVVLIHFIPLLLATINAFPFGRPNVDYLNEHGQRTEPFKLAVKQINANFINQQSDIMSIKNTAISLISGVGNAIDRSRFLSYLIADKIQVLNRQGYKAISISNYFCLDAYSFQVSQVSVLNINNHKIVFDPWSDNNQCLLWKHHNHSLDTQPWIQPIVISLQENFYGKEIYKQINNLPDTYLSNYFSRPENNTKFSSIIANLAQTNLYGGNIQSGTINNIIDNSKNRTLSRKISIKDINLDTTNDTFMSPNEIIDYQQQSNNILHTNHTLYPYFTNDFQEYINSFYPTFYPTIT